MIIATPDGFMVVDDGIATTGTIPADGRRSRAARRERDPVDLERTRRTARCRARQDRVDTDGEVARHYLGYLLVGRGLMDSTVTGYLATAAWFVTEACGDDPGRHASQGRMPRADA